MCPFIWCVFNDTLRHYASIPAYIPGVHRGIIPHTIPDVYPRCVSRRAPDVHSVLHLRSNLTFGHILPRILEQVLCLRYSTFLSLFITFIPFHSISMFERFINCIVSFLLCVFYDTILMHAHPGLPSRCVSRLCPACTRHPFRSTSSVISYLRSNLTADS